MAFKLTKAEDLQRNDLVDRLRDKWTEVEEALKNSERSIEVAVDDVNVKLHEYQAIVENAVEFRDNVAERLRGEFDEKSEGWQQGDKGQEAEGMASEWEGATLEDTVTVDCPSLEMETEGDHANVLESLPTEV